jgi:D-inositol-3-phosphate glycosyltransferase
LGLKVAMLSLHSCPMGKLGTRDTGGMNVFVRQIAQELGKLGVSVDMFTRQHPTCDREHVVNVTDMVRLIHLPADGIETKLGLYPHLPEMARAIQRFTEEYDTRYDVIHSHYWLSGVVGNELAAQWNVPHLTTLHTSARAKNFYLGAGSEPDLRSDTEADVLLKSDRVVVACARERSEIAKYYGVPEGKIGVVFAGVDHELFKAIPRHEARTRLGLSGSPLALFVGRLEPFKGVEVLLQALAMANSNGARGLSLAVVGGNLEGDDEMARLRRVAVDAGVTGAAMFMGSVEQADLPAYYSAADLCVLPSRYETFGLVILESLACGTPVASARVGCAEEVIKPGVNGWLLPEPSAIDMSSLFSRLAHSNEILEYQRGAQSSVRALTWSATASGLLKEYLALTS